MEGLKEAMLLYAVTDRSWLGDAQLSEHVEQAINGGATFVQLREKDVTDEEFLEQAKKVKAITDKHQIPFVINDNIEIAAAVDADGVHVGQSDMKAKDVRKLLGADKIIGVSAGNVEQAVLAEQSGADYIGVGAVFTTSTKLDAKAVSVEELKKIREAVSIPIVAIGGISAENILELQGSGIDGVAVVSALFAQNNITKAAEQMKELAKKVVIR